MNPVFLIYIMVWSGIQVEAMDMHCFVTIAKYCVGGAERLSVIPSNEDLSTMNAPSLHGVKKLFSCSNFCRCGAVGCCFVSHPVVGVSCSLLACCFDWALYDRVVESSYAVERKGLSRFHGSFDHSILTFKDLLEQDKIKKSIDEN